MIDGTATDIVTLFRVAAEVRAELEIPELPPETLGPFWVHAQGHTLWVDDSPAWHPLLEPRLLVEFVDSRGGQTFHVRVKRATKVKDYGRLDRAKVLEVAATLGINGLDEVITRNFGI